MFAELERRGWHAAAAFEDVASGKSMKRRLGLEAAIDHVRGVQGVLVAAKRDRISAT